MAVGSEGAPGNGVARCIPKLAGKAIAARRDSFAAVLLGGTPQLPKFGWPHAEEPSVQKSPYVILGIGVVGCLALAWMARHVHSQATVMRRTQPASVRPTYHVHLTSPVASRIERQGGTVKRFVTAHAVRGCVVRELAEWIARETQATAFG
ncbi:MAG: hypothetical protein ACK51X_00240, partial [Planctomycetota bacterium]